MSDVRNLSLRQRSLLNLLNNRAFSDAAVAEGTNANTFKTTATLNYTINGTFYTKAATDNIAFATAGSAFVAQPTATTSYYLFVIDTAGTITVVQGRDSGKSRAQGQPTPGEIPECPADRVPFAAMKIVNTSGADFTPGSTDLGAAGITDTYIGMSCIGVSTF